LTLSGGNISEVGKRHRGVPPACRGNSGVAARAFPGKTAGTGAGLFRGATIARIRIFMLQLLKALTVRMNTAVGLFSGFILLFAGVILFIEVVCRYSGHPTSWIPEVSVYLFAGAMLLGAAYTLMRERHVRVELLIDRFAPKTRDILYLVTSGGGAAFCGLVAYRGWFDLLEVIETGETTATTMRLPLWLTDLPLFVGFVLLTVQFFIFACDRVVRLRQGSPLEGPKTGGGH
jgi:TRAP-type C4-dicarboxylate transport system permease small subunit